MSLAVSSLSTTDRDVLTLIAAYRQRVQLDTDCNTHPDDIEYAPLTGLSIITSLQDHYSMRDVSQSLDTLVNLGWLTYADHGPRRYGYMTTWRARMALREFEQGIAKAADLLADTRSALCSR